MEVIRCVPWTMLKVLQQVHPPHSKAKSKNLVANSVHEGSRTSQVGQKSNGGSWTALQIRGGRYTGISNYLRFYSRTIYSVY